MTRTLTLQTKVYEPFPDGDVPKGWPKSYVSLATYRRVRTLLKKARAELRELDGGGGYLTDCDMP